MKTSGEILKEIVLMIDNSGQAGCFDEIHELLTENGLLNKTNNVKEFRMDHLFFEDSVEVFTENTVPSWLRFGGRKGSTMDERWFWNEHVMKLEVGGVVYTDFHEITRVK